jgi:hypothetical protein
MAYLSGNGNDFEKAINRGAGHFRSSELDSAVSAIHHYIRKPSQEQLVRVSRWLHTWRRRDPKEFGNRCPADMQLALRQEIAHIATSVYGMQASDVLSSLPTQATGATDTHTSAHDIAPVSTAPSFTSHAWKWVNDRKHRLDPMADYACGDALYGATKSGPPDSRGRQVWTGGFSGCINQNPAVYYKVVERALAFNNKSSGGALSGGQGMGGAMVSNKWSAPNVAMAAKLLQSRQGGVCSEFGKAAAHHLTEGRLTQPHPRVEIVAYKNHVFVLVGRKGGLVNGRVPDSWIHEPELVIVDAWAGSLGYDIVYQSINNYPLDMIRNLSIVMALDAS